MRMIARRPGWKVLAVAVIIIFAGGVVVLAGVGHHPVGLPTPRHAPQVAGTATATATATLTPSQSATVTPPPGRAPTRHPTPTPTPKAPTPTPTAPAVASGPSGVAMPTGDLPGWKNVFSDDFNGTALDSRSWGAYSGQPGGDPGGLWDPSHVVVHDGVLELQTYRDPVFGNRWVSGGLSSARALKQTYGKYLVRFRMDPGYGIAGIMLLWPSNDVWPPEIDFAEDGGGARDETTATLHYGATDAQIARSVKGDFRAWHTIGIEWGPGHLNYTLDGAVWGTLSTSRIPAEPMEMDIQTQAGTCGQVDTPCPNASTPAHINLQVDWVVAYQPA
jgi:beta-glucanase (GH16 family)